MDELPGFGAGRAGSAGVGRRHGGGLGGLRFSEQGRSGRRGAQAALNFFAGQILRESQSQGQGTAAFFGKQQQGMA